MPANNWKSYQMQRRERFMVCKRIILLGILWGISSFSWAASITGVVVDTSGSPIYNALVCLQGLSCTSRTDHHGRFRLEVDPTTAVPMITAGKLGFFNGARPFSSDSDSYRIVLRAVPTRDHEGYTWLSSVISPDSTYTSDGNEAKPCEVCHLSIVRQWQRDAHSGAATNPVFLSFFNGTDQYGNDMAGPGYRLDFPRSNGNCATCHIPALALESRLHVDPNEAEGVAKQGIFCDLCHKISGVRIDETGAKPGTLSIAFRRPAKGHQLFYGPYADVFPGEDGYHPLYSKSHYCAPCHHGTFWGVLAYSEFQEWQASSYRERDIHCQDCHMPADKTMLRFAPEEMGGILRKPETIPSHVNLGVQDKSFMKDAIEMNVRADETEDLLAIRVVVKNKKAGHHYPTGNPMRNMILLVEARDADGNVLKMVDGDRVPAWGGRGDPEMGNYAGMPGKGFAKVLKDAAAYPDRRQRHFAYLYPTPHWRPCTVASDNRIPADGSDSSLYRYALSKRHAWPIQISVRLLFRRGYKPWMDAKGFDFPDMEIANNQILLQR